MRLLTLPFRGLLWVLEEVTAQAERALYDEDGIRHALAELYRELEAGLISEAVFNERENELADRLAAAEEYARRAGGH
jgi:hypothetical protein